MSNLGRSRLTVFDVEGGRLYTRVMAKMDAQNVAGSGLCRNFILSFYCTTTIRARVVERLQIKKVLKFIVTIITKT